MNRKATLLVLAVFVLGMALGALLMYASEQRVMGQPEHSKESRKGQGGSTRLVDDLTRELALSAEQRQQLISILEDTRQKYDTIYNSIRPQFEQTRQEGRTRIRAILSSEQLPKFEEYLKRLDERRKRDPGK